MKIKSYHRNAIVGLQTACAMLFFCELLSILNAQWSTHPFSMPNAYEFILDLQEGFYLKTLRSILITIMLTMLGFLWYRGGLLRSIANTMTFILMGIVFSIILATLILNAWCTIHITTLGQWIEILGGLQHHTKFFHRVVMAAILGGAAPVSIAVYYLHEKWRQDNKALGDAYFSTGFETSKDGFFKKETANLIIGKKLGAPLYSNGFEHVLVFAPTGSGKTRSIAIPNLFHFPYSVVCNDVKFTLFDTTSGYRQNVLKHECYCFAPGRLTRVTHCYNPLDFIPTDKAARMTDIQRIAHIFIPDNVKDPIWGQTSRQLFKALLLFLLDSPERPTTFGEMSRLVKQADFDGWLAHELDNTEHHDPEFYRNGYAYINTPDKTRGNMLISFIGHFELFDDPIIDAATSHSDFDLRDLRRKKMTIYVGFTDEDMERLAPLITLFWQQLISFMIKEVPDVKKEPYPLLCLIDEFSSLGRLERLRRSLKLLREYRVRCILMFQYIAQTYEKYSHDEARAFTNIKTKVAYATEDIVDAEFLSKMLGTRTKRVVSRSISNQHNGSSRGQNTQYQAIPLMRPDEIMKMRSHIALIVRAGSAPIKAHQWIWYKESVMKGLSMSPINVPQQTIYQRPFVRNNMDDTSVAACIE